jgi:glutamate formiminotransferase / formiminotetrahydrofolate cyclodeaminase
MNGLIESVPNFSEGRNAATIEAIATALGSVPGAALLHVDSGHDANRSVYTLAGYPDAVAEALKAGARAAFELIDMSRQQGSHPRIGALDVLPLVPLGGMGMEECSHLAEALAEDIAEDLGVPFFLYARSARRPERKELSAIRRGGYEGLREKLADEAWIPDYGPRSFLPRWGASVCGARDFLIAWNLNLDTEDLSLAKAIAARLRAGPAGKGPFPGLKALGWQMPEFRCAQVSCNLYDFRAAPLAAVYAEIGALAREAGCALRGSELIGLVPLEALLAAGSTFLGSDAASREEKIEAAIRGLGLDALKPFEPGRRILEFALEARGFRIED